MGINLKVPKLTELRPRITVIGVGGAGGNAINNMIASGISGVDFVAANTDAQALASSNAEYRIQLGADLTEGLGAGARPEIGEAAAEEAFDEIKARVSGAHMVFIAAGMGGGTGTGAAAVCARAAREAGALTVAIVTKPFAFEGQRRMRIAEAGIEVLNGCVDTLIVIPNQNLFRVANEKTTFAEAFLLADQVLHSGIACITDLIVREGLINLDFADVRTVMAGMGTAMMGTGEAAGERRAVDAAELAILNPLLDDISLRGARGLLISISGSRNLTLYEVDEAASRIRHEVDPDANIIVGATFDDTLGDRIRVSIVASGLVGTELPDQQARPMPTRRPARPAAPAPSPAAGQQGAAEEPAAPSWSLAPEAPAAEHEADGGYAPYRREGDAHAGETDGAGGEDGAEAGEIWQGPGDVVIELGPPQAERSRPRPVPATQPAARDPRFTPQPPIDIRRPPRRMPEVEDFPSVGQREYLAKRGAPPETESTQAVEKKRPGLFARLTRRASDSRESGRTRNGQSSMRDADEAVEASRDAPQSRTQAAPHGGHANGGDGSADAASGHGWRRR